MLIFVINKQFHELVDAISILAETYNDTFELKYSPSMLSIMAATSPSSHCVLALQLSPNFFDVHNCNKVEYKRVYIQHFYDTMYDLQSSGFSSFAFGSFDSDQEPGYEAQKEICKVLDIEDGLYLTRNAIRIFRNEENDTYEQNDLPFRDSTDWMDDILGFDYTIFVSIESQEFINIITRFSNFDNVLVTISSEQVEFSYGRSTTTILTKEGNQCIIGGIEASDENNIFGIALQPKELFCKFVGGSKRVWLFKSIKSCRGVIAAPLGLYARYLAYFPYM